MLYYKILIYEFKMYSRMVYLILKHRTTIKVKD